MSISLSQGEATAIVVKAARGFGLSWGLAEEAGWALCQLGQYDNDVLSWFGHAFHATKEQCPITLGVTVMDHSPLPKRVAQQGGDLGLVRMPILLFPFLRKSAERVGHRLIFRETVGDLRIDVTDELDTHIKQLESVTVGHVVIEVGAVLNPDHGLKPKTHRFQTFTDTLTQLDLLGSRTYVPETEASRMSGAGAGASDND